MFEVLPESTRAKRSSLSSGLTSLALHGGVIALAAIATRASLNATSPPVHEVLIPPFASHTPLKSTAPPIRGSMPRPPTPIGQVILPTLPPLIPEVPSVSSSALDNLRRQITLTSREAIGEAFVERDGQLLPASGVWSAHLVDEPARVQTAAAPRYPARSEAAGISGQVVLEFVVDTMGSAEPASVRVVSSTHRDFEPAARDAVLATRFHPGKAGGLAVRQLVRQAVSFVAKGER